jgi:hypothetical protein
MAIDKQASIEKRAGAFKNYNVPVTKDGRPLPKNENGEYLDPATGQAYDPEVHGNVRRISRPVLNQEDLLDKFNFPLQARTLKLKKTQDIVRELQTAVNVSTCGVVNFVIGRDKDNWEAILRAAFPPGSGVAYKGFDGYEISASNWGNIEGCRNMLLQMILGNPTGIDRQTLDHYRRITTEMDAAPQEGSRPKPATPMAVLEPTKARAMFPPQGVPGTEAVSLRPGGQAPAAPQGGGGGDPNVRLYENILNHIEQLQAGAEEALRRMREIENRHDLEKDPNDPDKISQAKRYDDLKAYYDMCQRYIALRRSELPAIPMPFGGTTYDGTGFLDVTDVKKLFGRLAALSDPKKTIEYHVAETGAARNAPPPNEAMVKRVYEKHRLDMVSAVKAIQKSSSPDVQQACKIVLDIIEKPLEQIRAVAPEAFDRAISSLCTKITGQNRVLIVNNVDKSGLVDPGHDESGPLRFLADDVILDNFAPRSRRNKKAIVFVSRRPMSFGFDGAVWVPKVQTSMLVDEEEGMAIVSLFIEKCREAVRKRMEDVKARNARRARLPPGAPVPKELEIPPEFANLSLAVVNVDVSDIRRLAQMVEGKTQQAAYDFLYGVFSGIVDKKTGGIDGTMLSREARHKRNDEVRETSTFTDTAGKTFNLFRALARKEPKKSMEDYIYSRRTDWGKKVEELRNLVNLARSKSSEQRDLMARKHQIVMSGAAPGSEGATEVHRINKEIHDIDIVMRNLLQNDVKHFIILWGDPGCGKSVFAEVLAKMLGFDLVKCDVGQTRGGLVGQSEAFNKAMLDAIKRMSDVVIRIDEIDTQIAGREEEGRSTASAGQIGQFLEFFEEEQITLKERNIFIIATTNNPERVRGALVNRGDLHHVHLAYDQDTYMDFLDSAMNIIKSEQPLGLMYDPEATTPQSHDLWDETMRFWDSLRPDFPRMAQALVPTRMPIRTLVNFIYKMFAMHHQWVESRARTRLWSEDREKYKKKYSGYSKRDRDDNVVGWDPPTMSGFPFTADNFCRAAQMTHAEDRGERLDPNNPAHRARMSEGSGWVYGTGTLEAQINGRAEEGGGAASPQAEFDLFGGQGQDDMMPPASETTVASNDYYYEQLVKSGFARKVAQQAAQQAVAQPAQPQASETFKQACDRIAAGEFRDGDVYEDGVFGVYPIPPLRKIQAQSKE